MNRIHMASNLRRNAFMKKSLIETDGTFLPESYKKFFKEWKLTRPKPVHYIPPSAKWERNPETGEVKPLQETPIPLKFPPESHNGIWGGEGVIKGFQKRQRNKQRVAHFWVPNLTQSVVYSEILNKRMSLTVTQRTIDLILESHGFDHYILKNRACDLQSGLALKLKQKMLMSLFNFDLYPEDPTKKEEVYNKYKHYLEGYTKEDIEWYGLTFNEALKKYKDDQLSQPIVPLKISLRKQYIAHLIDMKNEPESDSLVDEERSWLKKLNPFSKD